VDLRTRQLVAWWCPDCGQQFEWDRWPVPEDLWVPLPEVKRGKDFVDTYANPGLIGSYSKGLYSQILPGKFMISEGPDKSLPVRLGTGAWKAVKTVVGGMAPACVMVTTAYVIWLIIVIISGGPTP
jgi:hypothetical protein